MKGMFAHAVAFRPQSTPLANLRNGLNRGVLAGAVDRAPQTLELGLPADEQAERPRRLLPRFERLLEEGGADEVVDVPGRGEGTLVHGGGRMYSLSMVEGE